MVTPWLAHPDGSRSWAAPAGLAVVLLVWNARYADVMRVIDDSYQRSAIR